MASYFLNECAVKATTSNAGDGVHYYLVCDNDGFLKTQQAMTRLNRAIKDGKYYAISDYDADVDTAAPKYWMVVTPNSTTRVKISATLSASGAGIMQLYEAPTVTDNGSALTIVNLNRVSASTSTATAFSDPTVTDDGTLLLTYMIPAGGVPKAVGSSVRQDTEVILKANTKYVFKFTPDADNVSAGLVAAWFEEL